MFLAHIGTGLYLPYLVGDSVIRGISDLGRKSKLFPS